MSETEPQSQAGPLSRGLVLIYGSVVYVWFLGTFLYLIGWSGDFWVPRSINGEATSSVGTAVAINVAILGLFAVQHTIMARAAFKSWWTRIIPEPIERSTFVLFTIAILNLLILEWRPLPDVVWQVDNAVFAGALWGLFGVGWAIVLASTFIIDHFDLFGIRQAIYHAMGRPYPSPKFQEIAFYRHVRHPLMLGFVVAFWAAPVMTQGRLLFAVVTSVYILIAIQIEERELVGIHGEDYEQYRRRVPMLIPTGRRDS